MEPGGGGAISESRRFCSSCSHARTSSSVASAAKVWRSAPSSVRSESVLVVPEDEEGAWACTAREGGGVGRGRGGRLGPRALSEAYFAWRVRGGGARCAQRARERGAAQHTCGRGGLRLLGDGLMAGELLGPLLLVLLEAAEQSRALLLVLPLAALQLLQLLVQGGDGFGRGWREGARGEEERGGVTEARAGGCRG